MSPVAATKQKPLEAEVLQEQPPAHPIAVTSPQPAPCPGLAAALAEAQRKCQRVAKESHNTFHRYDYASAESVIEAAQHALAGTGLSLLPLEQSLNGWERTGENRFELARKFLLLHASGESLPVQVAWPVVPDKGRPLDKATAIAATLSLAYLLRDLLLMPRVAPDDDVNTRDDTKAKAPVQQPAAEPQKSAAKQTKPAVSSELPKTAMELAKRLKLHEPAWIDAGLVKAGEVADQIGIFAQEQGFPTKREDWTAEHVVAAYTYARDIINRRTTDKARQPAAK